MIIAAARAVASVLLFRLTFAGSVPPPHYEYIPLSDPAALCLDGSRYGVWFCKAATNASWEFAIEGGGFCWTPELCGERAGTPLGSSLTWPSQHPVCLDSGTNYLSMNYCDGAAFSGSMAEAQPTGRGNETVFYRGIDILDAVLELSRELGLSDAHSVTMTGASAGGIATLMHLDRVAAFVAAAAPAAVVVGKPVAGYFIGSNATFNAQLGAVYAMQNVSGSLSAACRNAEAPESWRCFIPSVAAPYVETPFFLMQSRYDLWQLGQGELNIPCMRSQPFTPPYHPSTCTPAEDAAITAYGAVFMSAFFEPLMDIPHTRNGAFLSACIFHGSTDSPIDNVTGQAAFEEWVAGGGRQWWVAACNGSTSEGPCDPSPLCAPFP